MRPLDYLRNAPAGTQWQDGIPSDAAILRDMLLKALNQHLDPYAIEDQKRDAKTATGNTRHPPVMESMFMTPGRGINDTMPRGKLKRQTMGTDATTAAPSTTNRFPGGTEAGAQSSMVPSNGP